MPPAGITTSVLIFVAALLLRGAFLWTRGDFLEFDETFYLLIARNLLEGEGYRMNGLPQVAFPPLPALVNALLGLLWRDMVQASRLLDAVMGAALIFPVGAIARRAFGAQARWIAQGMVAVMPTLMTFAPISRPYAESLFFGPEPLYLLLFCCAGLALARALSGGGLPAAALCGLLAGLTYLTRNEAIAFAPVAALLLLLASPLRAKGAGAFLVTLACVSIPYPIYLHRVTGHWSISGKTASAVLIRESIARKVLDDDPRPFEALHYALDEPGVAMRSSYWGEDPETPRAVMETPLFDIAASDALANVRIAMSRMLPTILPWPIWPFALLGLVLAARQFFSAGPEPLGAFFSLAGMIVPSVLVCLLLFVEPRHHLYLVPVAVVFASGGVAWVQDRPRAGHGALRMLLPGLVCALLLWGALQQVVRVSEIERTRHSFAEIHRLGSRLQEELPAGEPIMSWHPAVAWYAHHPWRVLPAEKFARIAAYAARHHVRMVVFETQVHGPPPGQSADVPFAVFRIDPMPLEALAAGQFDLRKVEQDALYALYVVVPTGGAEPAAGGLPAR